MVLLFVIILIKCTVDRNLSFEVIYDSSHLKTVSVMVYFLVYYKSMLIFEREMDHSLEDLPEHGLEVLHDLGVHQAAPILGDDLRHVVRLQQAGVTLQSNCLLGIM